VAVVTGEAELGLRERKKQRTRALLIDSAIELCDRQGFERTTVDQIAAIAEVSPRTFSRYFATKDAVIMALIDQVVDSVAAELANQPADIGDLEALKAAHVSAFKNTTFAGAGALTSERLLATARIVTSSPALLLAVSEFRAQGTNLALAERMGVRCDDRRMQLVAALWSTVIMTALGEFGPGTDWDNVGIEAMIACLEETYAQFMDVIAGLQPHH
jgi:AcrR family transcriptional regulator